ncbi:MAG: pantetheine-phosphate adenylyltransferase [Thermoplasmata archaeon]
MALGGTFDRLHRGHERLLSAANRLGGELRVGLTTATYLRHHPKPNAAQIESYRRRRSRLLAWLTRHRRRPFRIVPLNDRIGGALGAEVTHLVVSSETRAAAQRIQAMRRSRGLPPVRLVRVPLLRGEDDRPIQSRRIRAGLIDPNGRRLLRPVRLRADFERPREASIAGRVLREFPQTDASVRTLRTSSTEWHLSSRTGPRRGERRLRATEKATGRQLSFRYRDRGADFERQLRLLVRRLLRRRA